MKGEIRKAFADFVDSDEYLNKMTKKGSISKSSGRPMNKIVAAINRLLEQKQPLTLATICREARLPQRQRYLASGLINNLVKRGSLKIVGRAAQKNAAIWEITETWPPVIQGRGRGEIAARLWDALLQIAEEKREFSRAEIIARAGFPIDIGPERWKYSSYFLAWKRAGAIEEVCRLPVAGSPAMYRLKRARGPADRPAVR